MIFKSATMLPVFDEHILNLMKHFTWKRQCNIMEKKAISSIKYICRNKQLKNLCKFMAMNINQQIMTLNIHKTPDSDVFRGFFSIFELKIRIFDEVYAYLILQYFSIPSIGLVKKILNGYHVFLHNDHELKFEKILQILTFFIFFFNL